MNATASAVLKRMTICKVADHDWARLPYPDSEGGGHFLRCRRCGKEDHHNGGPSVNMAWI